MSNIVLTGITTTGSPHLGNYVGAIKPAIASSVETNASHYFFLADYHALIKAQDPDKVHQSAREIAATWLALGLDPDRVTFYRQSDVPEITELTWLLTCVTAKGLMNRAHAYKDAVQKNIDANEDADTAITLGLFSYPVLMAADILMFNATHVPVGRDQIQHLEMARDIAQRFNHIYGKHFNLPQVVTADDSAILKGLDGRKMSKSYNNTIPLFLPEKQLKKHINRIVTNLLEPGQPKETDDSTLFQIWCAFSNDAEKQWMREQYAAGIAWGEAKRHLFEKINSEVAPARERYEAILHKPGYLEDVLQTGAAKARAVAQPFMQELRSAVGIRRL